MSLRLIRIVIGLLVGLSCSTVNAVERRSPNIVILYADDLGYGDLSCYGNKQTATPVLDRLAGEGVRCTDFYVAQAVCSASRTALLTGCYPNRIGMLGALGPKSRTGINADETTLAEVCRAAGYATAIVGKWHLGDARDFLPLQHGFDTYYGLPYSNDMWPFHPAGPKSFPALPLFRNNDVINNDVTAEVQATLTTEYTQQAVDFIKSNKERPYFLYVPFTMPHVPLFVSEKHRGKSSQGLYGDVLLEIDWSVGEILQALELTGVTKDTLVMFASDNGPWLSYGNHAGSSGGLREGKGTAWDGGVRVPCLLRWPGKIPAGTTLNQPWMTIDVLPTICALLGDALPAAARPKNKIDGRDVSAIWFQPNTQTEPAPYFFYWGQELQAIRYGDWKLHTPHTYNSLTKAAGRDGKPAGYTQAKTERVLYHLRTDPGETRDLSAEKPEEVAKLEKLLEGMRAELGDSLTKTTGKATRAAGRLPAASSPAK